MISVAICFAALFFMFAVIGETTGPSLSSIFWWFVGNLLAGILLAVSFAGLAYVCWWVFHP